MIAGIEEEITSLAGRQQGVVTRSQLLGAGLAANGVDRRVAAGLLVPLHRGAYLLGALRGRLEPTWARVMAAILACGDAAAASHLSAGCLWRLVRRPRRESPVHVTVLDGARRRRPGIIVHRATDLTRADVTRVEGIPVTGPVRTLRDLSAVLGVRALNRAAARAEREGLIDSATFPELVSRHGCRAGAPVLRAALLGEGGIVLT